MRFAPRALDAGELIVGNAREIVRSEIGEFWPDRQTGHIFRFVFSKEKVRMVACAYRLW